MKKNIITILAAIFIVSSCTETIEWEVDKNEAKLVVEGRITTDLLRHSVKLTGTTDYFDNVLPSGVSGASVTINDGTTDFLLTESDEKGVYMMDVPVAGEIGRTYQLNIDLAKPIGGKSHFTASSTIVEVMKIDSISIRQDTIRGNGSEDVLNILSFSGQETPTLHSFYLADVVINGESVIYSVNDYIYWDDFLIEDQYLKNLDLYYFETAPVSGDEIKLILYSIEEGYSDFIAQVIKEIYGSDELGFSGPPANVKGNISNGAIGYFYASDVNRITLMVE
jgi:hypothetical protein